MIRYTSKEKAQTFFLFVISIIFLYLLYFGVKDYNDYDSYLYDYSYNQESQGSPAFNWLESVCHQRGFSFSQFHFMMILLIFLPFSIIFVKLKVNPLVGIVCISLLQYMQIVNQIRYFAAFSFYVLSVIYLCYEKKVLLGILTMLLSFLFHTGIVPLFLFFPFYFLTKNLSLKKQVIVLLASGVVSTLLVSTFLIIFTNWRSSAQDYLDSGTIKFSSMLFLNIFPIVVLTLVVYYYKHCASYLNDIGLRFLATLALFPFFFSIISLVGYQIVYARFVVAFISVWLLYFYCTNRHHRFKFFIFFIIFFFFKYLFPIMVQGYASSDLNGALLIIKSINN